MMSPLAALLGALAGAILGSFLATVIIRWPQGRGVMRGRSACDSCGRTLGPRDLFPLVSALLSRG
ncbi:MAG: prepilin peptidase, partial [Pseudomonadota bacterium]|nr:prepilin peptidase [Pseudomonadota bacterium]